MIVDARQLVPGTNLKADICIVGAGPAGLLIASQLAALPIRIVVLEAGGQDASTLANDLLEGEDLTGEYHQPKDSRYCQLGGTVRMWNTTVDGEQGAKFVPLDAIDFEEREWIPHSGWPFSKKTLDPYY